MFETARRYFIAGAILLTAGCASQAGGSNSTASGQPTAAQTAPAPAAPGPLGESAKYGLAILNDTPKYMKPYIRADMSCTACHLQNATKSRGGSLVGVYARFPQYNKRGHRVIALQDRIAECFLYSMNGRVPPYQSKEMIGIVAYLAQISSGTAVGAKQDPAIGYDKFSPPSAPDANHGSRLYVQKCSVCHQPNGAGISGQFPPLWGPKSFNNGAGMHRLGTMASFVKHNMPLTAPNTLSSQEAYDVSAFVLKQERPKFAKSAVMSFPPVPAAYF